MTPNQFGALTISDGPPGALRPADLVNVALLSSVAPALARRPLVASVRDGWLQLRWWLLLEWLSARTTAADSCCWGRRLAMIPGVGSCSAPGALCGSISSSLAAWMRRRLVNRSWHRDRADHPALYKPPDI